MRALTLVAFVLIASFGVPISVLAQDTQTGLYNPVDTQQGLNNPADPTISLINPLGTSCNPANTDCLWNFLKSILAFVIRIGTVVVILMLVYVGFKFVTARGEPAEITKARTMFLWTVVGALILLGAQVIAVGITATVQSLGTGS